MPDFIYRLNFYLITLIRLFYSVLKGGEECVVCGSKTIIIPLCNCCKKSEFTISDPFVKRCKICGKSLISTKETCMECREKVVLNHIDIMFPLFTYRMWNKELLFLWKIKNIRGISFFFAEKLNEALTRLNCKIVVPVPPRKGKIAREGWDQIDEVCLILHVKYGVKILKLLERTSSMQQKKLDRQMRLEKIKSAYVLKESGKIVKELKKVGNSIPESLCLIDDVCTTGSTLECCAKLLKDSGVKKVLGLCLFTVD